MFSLRVPLCSNDGAGTDHLVQVYCAALWPEFANEQNWKWWLASRNKNCVRLLAQFKTLKAGVFVLAISKIM